MPRYTVTVKPRRPAFDDRGTTLEIVALTKTLAIKEARRLVRMNCMYDRHDGPLVYRGELAA